MAGGSMVVTEVSGRASEYGGRITSFVLLSCIMAAFGGLMFGYDIGISGGVTSMDDFLQAFFPTVLRKKENAEESNYCKFNNQQLQLFTSSLYLAALVATFFAANTTRKYGRRITILVAGLFFDAGVIFNAAAQNLLMLIIGRILLGCGVGFANQAVPLFLSEVAPAKWRGGMNILFQLSITIGILIANLVNYGTQRLHPWGWRVSLGGAAIPAILITIAGLVLNDTPNSLVERGKTDEARAVLLKIRGIDNVDAEMDDIIEASRIAQQIKHPFRTLWRQNKPQLAVTIALQIFQQLTGINAIMFYAPVLFQTVGFKTDAALYSAVITGGINVVATLVSVFQVDKWGRRVLLLEASVQMFVAQVIIGVLLGVTLRDNQQPTIAEAIAIIILVCTFVSGFAWSWGPLGWLIPSEIYPLETRSAGQSVAVCVNMLFTFLIAQAFLTMLCAFKFGIFIFFGGWVAVMGMATLWLLPETKGIPIEEMGLVWRKHWVWRKLLPADAKPPPHLEMLSLP